MEAHEGVGELVAVLDILRHRVVDVEQCNSVVAGTHTNILREGTIDIYLTGHGDTTAHKAAVYIAGLKAKLAWESRPALVGECHILT